VAALTLDELRRNGVFAELTTVFNSEPAARALLADVGYPRGQVPAMGMPDQFWDHVCFQIERGVIRGGLEALMALLADRYPGNDLYARWRRRESEPEQRPRSQGSYVTLQGHDDPYELLDRARDIARQLGLPGEVELGIAEDGRITLYLPAVPPEQALGMADRLRSGSLRATVAAGSFRDYVIQQLHVEGPDQARFKVENVPASTPTRDVARVVMAEYGDDMWPKDKDGRTRPATIDRVTPDGSAQRMQPDDSLHDNGIREGDTLSIGVQSTAGSVNPIIRDEALARARSQVLNYAQAHPGFEVLANAQHAPTEYVLRFAAPGWGPPAQKGGQPHPVDRHEVFLALPPDFPMSAPAAYWQTPIFHPNIHRERGKVCLGVLEDQYRPGMDFGLLCQMLVDIASYNNYEIREGYDEEARDWAVSPQGQLAIEQRGGRSVLRRLVQEFEEPRPVRIKRVDP
jgi:hypothetical protein